MTTFKDVKIVAAEPTGDMVDIGAVAAKALPPGRRYRYSRKLIYTLENGEKHDGEARGETKPKLQKAIENRIDYANRGCLWAVFADGVFQYTSIRVTIGIG